MTGKFFNFTDVLGYGWRTMKSNLWFFVGLGLLWLIITILPDMVRAISRHLHLPMAPHIVLDILLIALAFVIAIVLSIGMVRIALSFCDERKPPIGMLFDAWDCFWRYVAAGILYTLIILGGLILLIIPGIIWAIKYSLCYYFVIDKGLGPVQALKASSRTTMGAKWELFGFFILCGLINMLGVLCLIVGIFAAYPTVLVASALVYRQLAAQTPELAEFGVAAPSVEPAPESQPDEQEF